MDVEQILAGTGVAVVILFIPLWCIDDYDFKG